MEALMGLFCRSFSIPGDVHRGVETLLSTWLAGKGFELVNDRQLLELEDNHERGVFLIWNERWTIILYNNIFEEERLAYELKKLMRPLLHLWLHDSSVWGYDLAYDGQYVSTFISNRRYLGLLPAGDGPNDVDTLCRLSGTTGLQSTVRRLQRKKKISMDEVCRDFATLIGISPAATFYSFIENDAEAVEIDGFNLRHLRFRTIGWDPMEGFDLHRMEAVTYQGKSWYEESGPGILKPVVEVDDTAFKIEDALDLAQRTSRCLAQLRKPYLFQRMRFGWMKLCSKWKERLRLTLRKQKNRRETLSWRDEPKSYHQEGEYLVNRRHRCRIRLAGDATVNYDYPLPSMITSVFGFCAGGIEVDCEAMRPIQAERLLTSWDADAEVSESNYTIDGLPAKNVSVTERMDCGSCHHLYYAIQAPGAVYVFAATEDSEFTPDVRHAIGQVIRSFELIKENQMN
jgi:hypothetical protein